MNWSRRLRYPEGPSYARSALTRSRCRSEGHRRASVVCLQPTSAHAANVLGLSSQVPAQIVYLIDGSSRKITVGNQIIHSSTLVQGLCWGAGTLAGVAFVRAKPSYRWHYPAPSAEPAVRRKERIDEARASCATVDGFSKRRSHGLASRSLSE